MSIKDIETFTAAVLGTVGGWVVGPFGVGAIEVVGVGTGTVNVVLTGVGEGTFPPVGTFPPFVGEGIVTVVVPWEDGVGTGVPGVDFFDGEGAPVVVAGEEGSVGVGPFPTVDAEGVPVLVDGEEGTVGAGAFPTVDFVGVSTVPVGVGNVGDIAKG
jgi:hypothetical protein